MQNCGIDMDDHNDRSVDFLVDPVEMKRKHTTQKDSPSIKPAELVD